MGEIKSTIGVNLAGNVVATARKYGQAMKRFSRTGMESMRSLRGAANMAGKAVDKVGNRYTALISGAAGVGAAKQVMDLGERYTRLGIQANVSAQKVEHLKEEIYQASRAPDVRVDPSQMISAVESIVEKTGDLQFAQENIRAIGLAIQATGADGQAIGGIMAEFQKMGIIDPKEVMEAMDILTVQGKEGAFTLQNLAALGPRVVTAYTATGRGGVEAIREMGAALQVIRQGTGSSEMAATAFEAVMNTLGNAEKIKKLQAGGIQVFDPEALKEGKEVLRPINVLMAEIIQKTQGKKTLLSQVFDAEAMRAFNAASSEFKKTGSLNSLDKFMKVQADGTTIVKDSARAAETAAAAWTSLGVAMEKFADDNLSKRIQSLADTVGALSPEQVDTGLKWGGRAALGLGAMVVGKKVLNGVSWARGLFGKGKGRGKKGLAGKLLSGAADGDPVPVRVVNSDFGDVVGKSVGKSTKGLVKNLVGRGKGLSTLLKGSVGAAGLGTTFGAMAAAGAAGAAAGTGINWLLGKGIGWATGGKAKNIGDLWFDAIHGEDNWPSEAQIKSDVARLKGNSLEKLTEMFEAARAQGNQHATLVTGMALRQKHQETEVGGTIKLKVEGDGQVTVTGMETTNPNVNLEVDTGRVMSGI